MVNNISWFWAFSLYPDMFFCVHLREPSTSASAPWTKAEEEEAGASDGPV